jgi:16S rRNA U1498 N3-methylase RsmE
MRPEVASRARYVKLPHLGPRILRTETAGLVAASIILYEYGELG